MEIETRGITIDDINRSGDFKPPKKRAHWILSVDSNDLKLPLIKGPNQELFKNYLKKRKEKILNEVYSATPDF
jgi:hypothetical protein